MDVFKFKAWLKTKLPYKKQTKGFNQYSMDPLRKGINEESQTLWNTIMKKLNNSGLNYPIKRTKSGAIKKGCKNNLWNCAAYDVIGTARGCRLTIILGADTFVLTVGKGKVDKQQEVYPDRAFAAFYDKCSDYGINLDNYKISEDEALDIKGISRDGKQVHNKFPRPYIYMDEDVKVNVDHPGFSNVHHIDFHNSYPAGLVNTHPEFGPVIREFYALRKVDPVYKAVLNYSIGWMQSWEPDKNRKAAWAHLSRDAIKNNNERISSLRFILEMTGRKVLGCNTDGIWYQGDIYHGPGEGKALGQWENDHVNCIFRAKSDGAYEFIENGVYNAVVRGLIAYDAVEPDRTKWKWGDIYAGEIFRFKLTKDNYIEFIKGAENEDTF